ncbi:hypothetical protein P0D88_54095 [Paraburkholderia sp. RL18-103-BIB-C]|uniref:hypothetical protein n=1 Tax=unclassified Paraburkholderia TaxID=2615204 RepID=UPI0038B84496
MNMDDKLLLYNDSEATLDAASKRKIAVEVALELIRLDTASGSSRDSLDSHLRHLSDYADRIQQALVRKEP